MWARQLSWPGGLPERRRYRPADAGRADMKMALPGAPSVFRRAEKRGLSTRLHLHQYFVDNLIGRQFDTHGNRLIRARLFERIQLALQQRGIEEVPGARRQTLVQQPV